MNYSDLRHFADSWGLLFMALVYLGLVGWALLPRNRDRNREAAHMIFENDSSGKDSDHG